MSKTLDYLATLPEEIMLLSIGMHGCRALAGRIEEDKDMALSCYARGILEIGTCNAVSAVMLSEFGFVITLDVAQKEYAEQVVAKSPYPRRICRIVARDQVQARYMLSHAVCGADNGVFALAFIDAVHDYTNVFNDYCYARLLAERLAFHDYHAEKWPGVVKAVDEIAKIEGRRVNVLEKKGTCILE